MIMNINNKECKQPNNIDIFSCTSQTIQLYNELMEQQPIKIINNKNLQINLSKFYDGLIWAQKKNPLLVYQMFQMNALNKIIQKYIKQYPIVLLRNSTLLLGNCQLHGLIAQQLLQHTYPHFLLINIFHPDIFTKNKQQIQQYIGSFLKSYHKLFKIQWLQKFILPNNYFQLLEINLKFYNCLEFITRTNSLNIILDLFNYQEIGQFISNCKERTIFYQGIFNRMTKLFKNQLGEFGLRIMHISEEDNIDLILDELEDKIVLWEDISKNSKSFQNLIQLSFSRNVLFPLMIGPLKWNQIPLFSLKFSLFVLKKLIKAMKNIGALQVFIRLLFVQEIVMFQPSTLSKALIPPFSLKSLTNIQLYKDQQQQRYQELSQINIKKFYQNLFTSKDNHFILMTNTLITTLFLQIQQCTTLMQQYGLNYGGSLYLKIGNNLLSQLQDPHTLYTVQSILYTLITMGLGKSLETELCNKYIYYFQKFITELKNNLKGDKQCINYLTEVVQYDINIIHQVEFIKQETTQKYEKLFKIVFVWDFQKQQQNNNQFYSKIPENSSQHIRYRYIKFMLLRKAQPILLQGIIQDSLLLHYYSLIITQSPYIVGDIYQLKQFNNQLYQCQITQHKTNYLALCIKNQDFFVLAKLENQSTLQIIQAVKAKHLRIQDYKNKQLKICIREFEQKKQDTVERRLLKLKGKQQMYEMIKNAKKIVFNKHFQFIKESLEKTLSNIPTPSLI